MLETTFFAGPENGEKLLRISGDVDGTHYDVEYLRFPEDREYQIVETITWKPFSKCSGIVLSHRRLSFEETVDDMYTIGLHGIFEAGKIQFTDKAIEDFIAKRIRLAIKNYKK